MKIRNYAIALPAAAGLAALLLTACGGAASSRPSAGTTTSQAQDRAASTVSVTSQEDSNWAGYVASSATTNTSFSNVSGSWTQPAVDCTAGSASHSAFWVGIGGYTGTHLEQTGTSADCSASGQAAYSVWYELGTPRSASS